MLKSDSEQSDNFTSDRTRGQVGSSLPDVEVGILASPYKKNQSFTTISQLDWGGGQTNSRNDIMFLFYDTCCIK